MTADIARREAIDALPVDYAAVLGVLGLRGSDPKSQAVVAVCQRYQLDPILKHVVLVDGNVYVTRDGLLHVAHQTGQFDGLEVDEARLSDDGKEWRSRATVYRKDMSRPVSFSGRYPTGKKNAPEMAEKVAVARSLRHAFDVAIATEDERQAQAAIPETPSRRVTAAEITAPARQRPSSPVPAEPEPPVDIATGEVLPVEDPDEPDWPETRKPADS